MIESIGIETLPNINSNKGDYTLAPLMAEFCGECNTHRLSRFLEEGLEILKL